MKETARSTPHNVIIFYQETVSLGVHEKETKSITSMTKAFS